MSALSVLPLLIVALQPQSGQKRPLTHADTARWRSIRQSVISHDGRWVAMSIAPREGDGELVVRETTGKRRFTHPRGQGAAFSRDGRFCVFLVEPTKAEKDAFEKGRKKKGRGKPDKSKGPKKDLVFLDLESAKLGTVERVKSFRLPEEGPSVLVYLLEKLEKPEKKPAKKGDGRRGEKQPGKKGGKKTAKPDKKPGSTLVLYDLVNRKRLARWPDVLSYGIAKKRRLLWFVQAAAKDGPKQSGGLFVLGFDAEGKARCLAPGPGKFKPPVFDKEEHAMAFLFRPGRSPEDKEAEEEPETGEEARERKDEKQTEKQDEKPYDLYLWDFERPSARRALQSRDLPEFSGDHELSPDTPLVFSKDGSVLLVGVKEREPEMPELGAGEKVTLDLWHWKDPLLQPMQAKRAAQDRKRAIPCAWHPGSEDLVVLGTKESGRIQLITKDGTLGLVHDTRPYARELSWDGRYSDVYTVRTIDGKRTRVLSRLRGRARPSSTGRWLIYFGADRDWHTIDVTSGKHHNLTKGLEVLWHREDWDKPGPARAYGVAGWVEEDRYVLIHDRYDLWRFAPDGSTRSCVTDGLGRARKIVLRYAREDQEKDFVDPDERVLLSATSEETMASGYYEDKVEGIFKPRQLILLDRAFGRRLLKAKGAERFVFSLSSFERYPDLWTADGDFKVRKRLSNVNPQQAEFRWGRSELVRWRSSDGVPLKGVLIKPDGFDPEKKHPLMVYIYEQRSRGLHRYRSPAPGTSPSASYYVSNGYLWFEPDIHYRVGYPGASCKSCVIPGVLQLVKSGFVDEEAIGIAGHSWGGYQTAWLVTQTDLFKAAESGAPVSNMISAYGGIRWGSGMSRAFQYEKSQSRIGGSPWEFPLRYLENSPVFFADKVQTPLLMLHNDRDGAVPWYQGIELFTALRRLGREAYLFNYNEQGHGLRREADRKDWARRMQEFFDHHLRGHPAPAWMREGVPYIAREREKLQYRTQKPEASEFAGAAEASA
ncbi:MAG: alpha/beta hydrolase family protein, partial [Planctomycetota bacterium]